MAENENRVFVVMGTTGEYSDRTEWPVLAFAVLAFASEEEAKNHVENATRRASELFVTRKNRYEVDKSANEFDKEMLMDYTGTSYYYFEIEVRR